jgi:hypothetical protein
MRRFAVNNWLDVFLGAFFFFSFSFYVGLGVLSYVHLGKLPGEFAIFYVFGAGILFALPLSFMMRPITVTIPDVTDERTRRLMSILIQMRLYPAHTVNGYTTFDRPWGWRRRAVLVIGFMPTGYEIFGQYAAVRGLRREFSRNTEFSS